MQRVKFFFRITVFVLFGLLLHYALPQKDVVRITGISDRIETLSTFQRYFYAQTDAGADEGTIRDLRLINTVRVKTYIFGLVRSGEGVMVYRNEDTGLIWPPYFKFDSSNLEAETQAFIAQSDQWVQLTHYGWRIPFLSIYPNAISVTPVDGPTHRPIPWFNIGFFIFLMIAIVLIRAMWMQFRERSVDPLLDSAGDSYDELQAGVAEKRSGLRKWINSWRAKDKRS